MNMWFVAPQISVTNCWLCQRHTRFWRADDAGSSRLQCYLRQIFASYLLVFGMSLARVSVIKAHEAMYMSRIQSLPLIRAIKIMQLPFKDQKRLSKQNRVYLKIEDILKVVSTFHSTTMIRGYLFKLQLPSTSFESLQRTRL